MKAQARLTRCGAIGDGAPVPRRAASSVLLALGFLALLDPAAVSSAQSGLRVEVEVHGGCVDPSAVRSRIAERAVGDAAVAVEVRCEPEIRVDIRVEENGRTSERTLRVAPGELEDMAEAIALVVAIALDAEPEAPSEPRPGGVVPGPGAESAGSGTVGSAEVGSAEVGSAEVGSAEVGSAEVGSAESANSGPVGSENVSSETVSSETVSSEAGAESGEARGRAGLAEPRSPPSPAPRLELHAGFSFVAGVLSEPGPGALVGGAWRLDSLISVEAHLAGWAPQRVSFDPRGRVALVPWSVRAGPCAAGATVLRPGVSVEIGACAALWVGATVALPSGFEASWERWEPRVAVSLRPRLGLVLDAFLLRIELEAGLNVVSPSFYVLVDGVSRVYADRAGLAWGGIALLVGVRWAP